jgi:hypothetical protein
MNPFDKYSGDVLITLKENTTLTTSTATLPSDALTLRNASFGSLGSNIKAFLEVVRTAGSIEILNIEFDSVNTFNSADLVTYSASNYKTSIYSNDRTSDVEPFAQTKLIADGKSSIAFSNLANSTHKFVRFNIKTVGFSGTYRLNVLTESLTNPLKQV